MRRVSAFTLACCCVLLGCDSEGSSSKSASQTDQEKFEKDVLGVTNAYRDAFEAVASSLSKPAHPDTPCGDALPHETPAEHWVGPTSIALTEDALQWFVSHPPTKSSEAEDVQDWAQGALGYLNFSGFADHRQFVGGALSGVLEVFDGSSGKYVCGHRVSARNSQKFKSYLSGKKAIFDDLSQNLAKDANKKFARPVVRVYEPKE